MLSSSFQKSELVLGELSRLGRLSASFAFAWPCCVSGTLSVSYEESSAVAGGGARLGMLSSSLSSMTIARHPVAQDTPVRVGRLVLMTLAAFACCGVKFVVAWLA